ncbi:MAG: alpha-L-fucosidase [Planctomycetota bacterium]
MTRTIAEICLSSMALCSVVMFSVCAAERRSIRPATDKGIYEATWESLSKNPIPEWLLDAKFGVYTHWGVYSVPAHGGPDYVKNLYAPEQDVKGVYTYHTEKYGQLKDFGYKDFVPLFTAPKFDADEWVGLMHEAGAKFGGICLVHHDGFLLWDSKVNRWNARNMGPKRDIYGEIAAAVRKYDDMKLLATFHHGRTYGYPFGFLRKEGITDEMRRHWDLFDPKYNDFYWGQETREAQDFSDEWKAKIVEVIDNYSPDLIWFDGLRSCMKNAHPPESYVLDVFAHYFNQARNKGQSVTICNKHAGDFNFPASFGLRCYENGRDMPLDVEPWFLIDRAIAYPWCYVNNKQYRDGAGYHVKSLVDLVSRGGIFLLSLTPKGDGSIPEEEQKIMRGMGRWLQTNGEAIYGTRRWKVVGEGAAVMMKYNETKRRMDWNYRQEFSARDIRFTRNGDRLYAIALNWPENGRVSIESLKKGSNLYPGTIDSVVLLGGSAPVGWKRTAQALEIALPEDKPCAHAYAFRIEGEDGLP